MISNNDLVVSKSVSRVSVTNARSATGIGHAHGKVILAGEHAVLHGQPAIAVPLAQIAAQVRVEMHSTPLAKPSSVRYVDSVTGESTQVSSESLQQLRIETLCRRLDIPERGLHITIDNGIPYGRGLGSSAAVASALVRALADSRGLRLDHEEQLRLVSIVEASAHGKASGVDAHAVSAVGERVLWFEHGKAEALSVAPASGAVLVVADSGQPSSTAATVRAVAALAERHPESTQRTMDRIGVIVRHSAEFLADGDMVGLGNALSENHSLLCELDLSTSTVDRLVTKATTAGATGAKVSGGGRGGCIVAVCACDRVARGVRQALLASGASQCWTRPLHPAGVAA